MKKDTAGFSASGRTVSLALLSVLAASFVASPLVAAGPGPRILCIEIESEATASSLPSLEGYLRKALHDLDLENIIEEKQPQCTDSNKYRLRDLQAREYYGDLRISGSFSGPGLPEGIPSGPVTCRGCSANEQGVEEALGLFLNETLFRWDLSLLGAFRLESCTARGRRVETSLRLENGLSVAKLEPVSYAVGLVSHLDRVTRVKPTATFLELAGSPPASIPVGRDFAVSFRWHQQHNEMELSYLGRYHCPDPSGKRAQMLFPMYFVNYYVVQAMEEQLEDRSAGYVMHSSSISPSKRSKP